MSELVRAFIRQQLGSLVRAALIVFGAVLVQHNVVDQATADSFVESLLAIVANGAPILVSLGWSWYRNRQVARIVEGE